MNDIRIMIVGVGGQGILLASRVIGSVALEQGYDLKLSEIHGMAQRGGSVVSCIKMGDKIYSPVIEKGEADIILSFEKLEALRWLEYLKPGGRMIINKQEINPVPVLIGQAEYPERSEEHTSELQSRPHLVCRLLLEKKKKYTEC